MIGLREAHGRPVLSRSSAEQVGEVRAFVLDAKDRRVVALAVRQGRATQLVPWEAITGFGPDAVLVESAERLREPSSDREREDAGGRRDPVGKRFLNDQGIGAGTVLDVEIDETSGRVERIVGDHATVDADRLRGVGSYAVVVAASDEARAALG